MSELIESGPIYRFGRFSLDPGERLLLCDAEPVDLTPRAFDLLVVLAENPGRLLDKRLLMERVWGGTFVEEANLSNNISLLRKVLAAPGGEARYIETVPRRGYRFVASVTKLTPAEHAPMSVPETPANAPHPAVTSSRTIVTPLLGVAVGVVLAVGALVLSIRSGPRDRVPFAGRAIAKLTYTGRATHAAVSCDGRYVAYVEQSPDGPSVWVRQLGAADSVQLAPPTRRQYVGLTFSPDGSYIYYVVREAPFITEGALYRVRVQGGPSRRMLTRISSPISFAPGGAEFAYLRVPQEAPGSLMVATLDTAKEDVAAIRILAEGRFPFVSGVAWSPDGSVIATVQGAQSTGGGVGLVAVRVDDRRLLAMSEGQWRRVTRLAWLADGGGLMINAEEQLDVGQIWHVAYPSGTSQRVTVDASTDNAGLTLTADSRMLVAIHEDHTSTIWVQDHADTPARQITFGKYDGRFGVQWTPDDRIVYSSMESGNDDIWLMNADGSARRQLTTHPAVDDKPSVSADGRYVLFNSDRAGAFDLWRMDINGGNQTRLTRDIRIRAHQASHTARFAVASGNARLWKVPIDDGDPEPLSDAIAFSPAVSSDGQFVAACWRADRRSPPRLAVFPASGGQPFSVFNAECHPFDNGAIRWSVDDRDITYTWEGRIWAQAREGGQPRLHPSVAYQDVLQFDWSASGRLVLARGDQSGDVVIIRR